MSTIQDKKKQQEHINKCFGLAEVPIKDWLILYAAKTDVKGQVDCRNEIADDMFIETSNKEHYKLSLEINGRPLFSVINKEKFIQDDKLRNAVGLFYEAVNMVYAPVVKTLIMNDNIFDTIFPKFDNDDLSFMLVAVNKLMAKKLMLEQAIMQLNQKNQQSESKLTEQLSKTIREYNEITDEMISVEEKTCEKQNKILSTLPKLFITASTIDKDDMYKRLEIFGEAYVDIND
jgi:hypothetical protein